MSPPTVSALPIRVSADLLDLRLAAGQLESFLRDQSAESFLADPLTRDATLFLLERIASIVNRLPPSARDRYPDLAWSNLARFTVEQTYGISDDEMADVWEIATKDVPGLLAVEVPVDEDDHRVRPPAQTGQPQVRLSRGDVAKFARRWKIVELAVFGSALRDDFQPNSDLDVLVTFADDASWTLFDHVLMEEELEMLVGREVDLVERRTVERSPNWIRRRAILSTAVPIHVAS